MNEFVDQVSQAPALPSFVQSMRQTFYPMTEGLELCVCF